MSNDAVFPEPPPLPSETDRRAAWWSWPLIVISVLLIGWSVNWFAPEENTAEEGAPVAKARASSPEDLAILKIQAQVVIASSALAPAEAENALDQLEEMVVDDHSAAAVALVIRFIGGEASEEKALQTIEKVSDKNPAIILRRAIEEGIDAEDRQKLRTSLGWFAELAPLPGGDPAPESDAIRGKAMIVLVLGVGLFLTAITAIAIGAIFLFLMIRKEREKGGVCAFRPSTVPRGIMLECFALYLGIMASGEIFGIAAPYLGEAILAAIENPFFTVFLYSSAVVIPLLWPLLRGVRWKDFRRSLGLHRGRGIWREIGAGIFGYTGVIAIASIGIFLTLILTAVVGLVGAHFADPESLSQGAEMAGEPGPHTHPIVGWVYTGGWGQRLFCLFLAAGFAPVFEELFFRGALHRYLRGRFHFFASALLTGLIFAALHPQGWMGVPALAAIGIGFSLLREWRDSLIGPMVAHSLNNGILVTMLFLAL